MADPYLGEIRVFGGGFAPEGWAFCDGATLAIKDYDGLFSLHGSPTASNPNVACSINGASDLSCVTSGALRLAPSASFTVSFSAVARVVDSYIAPRPGGVCGADPNNLIVDPGIWL